MKSTLSRSSVIKSTGEVHSLLHGRCDDDEWQTLAHVIYSASYYRYYVPMHWNLPPLGRRPGRLSEAASLPACFN